MLSYTHSVPRGNGYRVWATMPGSALVRTRTEDDTWAIDHAWVGERVNTVLQAAAIIALCIGAALVGQILVRRLVEQDLLSRHTAVAGIVYATLAVVYGVILGQVVIAAWNDYVDAQAAVQEEANSLVNLHRLAAPWPAAERDATRQALVAYAQDVVANEWPALRRGESIAVPGGYPPMLAIWDAYQSITDAEIRGSVEFATSMSELVNLESARGLRLFVSEQPLPQLLWAALIAGAVITVAFSYLLAVESQILQSMMLSALAGLIALLLFLVHTLEYPFIGDSGIEPEPFQVMLLITEQAQTPGGDPALVVATPAARRSAP